MPESTLTIGGRRYTLGRVILSVHCYEWRGEPLLQISIGSDRGESPEAGLALNCLAVSGIAELAELQGKTLSLQEEASDGVNDLGESVVWEQGNTLEMQSVVLRFGQVAEGVVEMEMEALCFRFSLDKMEAVEADIPVTGHLLAALESPEPLEPPDPE